ncbi:MULTISPECIES: arginase [Agrobacterium]|uniref:Arginase n=1 Tax=Agrobacterium salinitolerans TaxID=1183413 RepID=A0A1S9E9Y4_9HYPH|nr:MULTISPECIES: arginase [Agrobacterium]PNQ21330.1 arginase [Rhizobium sp. YIC5082]MCZ7853730.1 arginase [Agrobacterium salinitolerans]MCZ7887912.1 arginase [Agrobacterium salinitolerans]MCZ7893104.1 arginase [Agrobacterium salinitolerans]MCZ7938038.1 arginase [Agrobacterium salinitolerans]
MEIRLVGAPLQIGAGQLGCEMGPSAYRVAGLAYALEELGHRVVDTGNVTPATFREFNHPNPAVHHLPETVAWTEALTEAAYRESADAVPIFLGGDHAISAGTVAGMARRVAEKGRPFFVLWLDAHTDYHTLETTRSGNLHGTPVAYFSGRKGFDGYFPPLSHAVPEENIGMIGIRSVDPAERAALEKSGITVHDMRSIDEHGVAVLLREFLARVQAANGLLHVSLDVDFLEPSIAPAVGTTVPGGATFREAHLVMEMLHDSGLVCSLDLVELNPFLDERGRTATLMVDLAASLLGKRVMDRPTRAG